MNRIIALLYGIISYLIFLATIIYAIGFFGNFIVPKSIDSSEMDTVAHSLIINFTLIGIFAIQHSVMARPAFKHWVMHFIPQAIERSTYVLLSSLALILLYWQWRPINMMVWNVENSVGYYALWILYSVGWLILLISTFLISHFDLFGIRQVYLNIKCHEYTDIPFSTPFFYKLVRHPIMLGFIIIFWTTPYMTVAHLVFSTVITIYIIIALQLEEHDLINYYGHLYKAYQQKVSMILPIPKKEKMVKIK